MVPIHLNYEKYDGKDNVMTYSSTILYVYIVIINWPIDEISTRISRYVSKQTSN
jgi:hypothetical protein